VTKNHPQTILKGIEVTWTEDDSRMTQMGGLAYFVNFLKASGLFDHLVEACPLAYESNNAPEKRDVLGTMLLSVLSVQNHDAHTFVSDLIRKARKSLILIDNYVDDTVLTLLAKRKKTVSVTIYTKKLSKQLALDLQKHNQQYSPITVETFADTHDRFLITAKGTFTTSAPHSRIWVKNGSPSPNLKPTHSKCCKN
jgi:hypothetical protein